MKNRRSLLSINLLALISALLLSSVAYFTSQDRVENRFTVGDIQISLEEPNFYSPNKMTEKEKEAVKEKLQNENKTAEQIEKIINEHKDNAHMTPGKVIVKDPTVTLDKNSEDSYVFIAIDNHITNVLDEIITSDKWELVDEISDTSNANRLVSIYVYKETDDKVLRKNDKDLKLEPLFKQIIVKTASDGESLNHLDTLDNHIDVIAFAHQADVNGKYEYDLAKAAAIQFFSDEFNIK